MRDDNINKHIPNNTHLLVLNVRFLILPSIIKSPPIVGREFVMGWNLGLPWNTASMDIDSPRESLVMTFYETASCRRIMETPTYFRITTPFAQKLRTIFYILLMYNIS